MSNPVNKAKRRRVRMWCRLRREQRTSRWSEQRRAIILEWLEGTLTAPEVRHYRGLLPPRVP